MRRKAWKIKGAAQASPVRGLVGARVHPLPHQLYIASEVSRRPFPRVLLADEVGLGKTIEAGLIYSALKSLGQADRVLIVTPEALVHQWMAEIYRRFGDMFSVLSAGRCDEEEASQMASGFSTSQNILVSMDFLQQDPIRCRQALGESWDLVIMDEAHHLDWDEEEPDPKWLIAEKLSRACTSLLLLTATPRQHGLTTQFGLLKLVDPDRYQDFDAFLEESQGLKRSADLAREIMDSATIGARLREKIEKAFPDDPLLTSCLNVQKEPEGQKDSLLRALVDRHGPGRVLMRNRRERLKGFPERILEDFALDPGDCFHEHLRELDCGALSDLNLMDYATGRGHKRSFTYPVAKNPRYLWLLSWLHQHPASKALVICATIERVFELEKFLAEHAGVEVLTFHEGQSMVQRDQKAARFSQPKGPALLICSEIGGEGRNFQFVNQLILMDLPKLPDLLEQRIGRLDRIGQGKEVRILVPWLRGTPEEVLFSWYRDGIDSFGTSWNGADPLLEHFAEDLLVLFRMFFPNHEDYRKRHDYLSGLIQRTQHEARRTRAERAESVDVLIDQNSFIPDRGEALRDLVWDCDDDTSVEFFIKDMFDHYAVEYEELDDRGSLIVKAESIKFIDHFPGLGEDKDLMITFDREVALAREDISFVTWDHPMAEGCLSLLLERDEGAFCLCRWPGSGRGVGILIDVSVILSAQGPRYLELDKYLPLSCKEYTLNQNSEPVKRRPYKQAPHLLEELGEDKLPFTREQLKKSLTPVLDAILRKSRIWAGILREKAILKARDEFGVELERLEYLNKVNPAVTARETESLKIRRNKALEQLKKAEPRIDGLRVIFTS